MKASKPAPELKPGNTVIYEINTWIWLRELSIKHKKKINLGNIPAKEFDELAREKYDAIWLMGVWKRSPAGLDIAKKHEVIMRELHEALPDLKDEDIAGSAYCIKDYQVDPAIGGDKGLTKFRKELAARGMSLLLDFVPNHVAPDHPWTRSNPDYFIKGSEEEFSTRPDDFIRVGKNIYAKGKDPFYPPWPDVLQLNLFDEGLRAELLQTLIKIAGQCDGIRCDMAMLVMNDIFRKNWNDKAGKIPRVDFWKHVIPAVKKHNPQFIFIAESYWDTELELISQGFDFCYDKRYYDHLKEGASPSLDHLIAHHSMQPHLLRFLENHDEARAAGLFDVNRNKALAVASLTLPGAVLVHEGQLEGRTVKVPVFLSRRKEEPQNHELKKFYLQLLKVLRFDAIRKGKWSLCELSGWSDNMSCLNLLAWEWVSDHENLMVVVNLSDHPAQAHVKPGYAYRPGTTYQLFDVTSGELYRRDGEEMTQPGLYVVLQGWGMHVFSIER